MDSWDKAHEQIDEELERGDITQAEANRYHREVEAEREDMTEYAPVVISIECENNNPSITKLISRISSGNDSDVIEVMGAPFTLYGHRVTLSDHAVVQFGLYPVK